MKPKENKSGVSWNIYKFGISDVIIYAILIIIATICLFPLLNMVAISFSSASASNAGIVYFWPVKFTTASYNKIFEEGTFFQAFRVSSVRVVLGWAITMTIMILMAYPLSKEKGEFRSRNIFMWMMVFTMLFSGGLIPTYMTIRSLNLIDSIWALVLPSSVSAGNTIILMRFFRNNPKEIEEAAIVGGAGAMRILLTIILPISLPAIATLSLFVIVYHWNDFFAGMIYINDPAKYPLQTYIRSLTVDINFDHLSVEEIEEQLKISSRTFNAAKIVVSMVPILCIYPFLQRYFVKGLVLGSVKG